MTSGERYLWLFHGANYIASAMAREYPFPDLYPSRIGAMRSVPMNPETGDPFSLYIKRISGLPTDLREKLVEWSMVSDEAMYAVSIRVGAVVNLASPSRIIRKNSYTTEAIFSRFLPYLFRGGLSERGLTDKDILVGLVYEEEKEVWERIRKLAADRSHIKGASELRLNRSDWDKGKKKGGKKTGRKYVVRAVKPSPGTSVGTEASPSGKPHPPEKP